MTNKEWLDYLAHNAPDELAAWFDAEHTESPTSETMQQIGQVIESTVKRGVYGDTDAQDADSREQLEADIRKYANPEGNTGTLGACWERKMLEFIDRQAAITEQEVEHDLMKAGRMAVEVERERIKKLTAERDELKAEHERIVQELVDANTRQCERTNELTAERDNWKASCEDWKKHARAAENACYETMLEREDYRKKFGKCLDYADAIHALGNMDS